MDKDNYDFHHYHDDDYYHDGDYYYYDNFYHYYGDDVNSDDHCAPCRWQEYCYGC